MVFVLASVVCGALAVPWHPFNTPIAAAVGGLLAVLALGAQRWSRIPAARTVAPPAGVAARVRSAGGWFLVGLGVGLLLLGAIRFVIEPAVPAASMRITAAGLLPYWRRALIIYNAAVGEELLFRVLLLSLVAGFLARVRSAVVRLPAGAGPAGPTAAVRWSATILAALAFAAVHLPAWSGIGALTAGTAAMVIVLNGIGGTVFGYAFVTRGILAAICAHAGADCAIQIIGPLT